MARHADIELKSLSGKILAMGERVETAIGLAVTGLTEKNSRLFDGVMETEKVINQWHVDIDDFCLKLLATQAPVAGDLRLVVAIMKINSDLERMGDQAVNISHSGRHYLRRPFSNSVEHDLERMAAEARTMVGEALESFLEQNISLATGVLLRDSFVDTLKDEVFRKLIPFMESDSNTVQQSLDLILIARNLERIGDHATNIAEDVIFACTGEDIRHTARRNDRAEMEKIR